MPIILKGTKGTLFYTYSVYALHYKIYKENYLPEKSDICEESLISIFFVRMAIVWEFISKEPQCSFLTEIEKHHLCIIYNLILDNKPLNFFINRETLLDDRKKSLKIATPVLSILTDSRIIDRSVFRRSLCVLVLTRHLREDTHNSFSFRDFHILGSMP